MLRALAAVTLVRRGFVAIGGQAMNDRAAGGDYVRIKQIILRPEERAPNLPPETRATALQLWVNGRLVSGPASLGDTVVIETAIGRRLEGQLVDLHPRYAHDFGDPQPELMDAARKMHERLP